VAVMSVLIRYRNRKPARGIIVIVFLGVSLYLGTILVSSSPLDKFIGLYNMCLGSDFGPSSFTDRAYVWSQIWDIVSKTPFSLFLGIPYDIARQTNNWWSIAADSDYMFMILYSGIIGLGAFLLLYCCIHLRLKHTLEVPSGDHPEREALLIAARGIFFGIVVAGFAGGFMSGGSTAWRTTFVVLTLIGASLGGPRRTKDQA
jgi:hypothetical protein